MTACPAVVPIRKTVTALTDPELTDLYDQLSQLRAATREVEQVCRRHTAQARALARSGHSTAAAAAAGVAAEVQGALHRAEALPTQKTEQGTTS